MKRALVISALFALALHALVDAQSRTNVSVLPAYLDPLDPESYLKGDQYMQRQVEPSYLVSTRNPDHHIVFFNDYRAVDVVTGDVGLGERSQGTSLFGMLARLFRKPAPPKPTVRAAAEAYVGYSVTYDNGATWSGGFIPGAPFDTSEAGLASPIHGTQAATDPAGFPAPCGRFYVAFIAFTRNQRSYLAVARYEDRNNTDGGHDVQYIDTKVIMNGAASATGLFIDKPVLIVDPKRTGGDACGHNVYVAFSAFDGLEANGRFRSRLMVARSLDGGETWSQPTKISEPYTHNQGAALAVDPRQNGGGAVYVMWRSFDPQGMLFARSTDSARTFGRPILVNSSALQPFDQPTLTAPPAGLDGWQGYAFRTNALPTMVAAHNGTIFAAWQERVSLDLCGNTPQGTTCGRPVAGGTPRIVMMRSTDAGATWTDTEGNPGERRAVDFGDRYENAVQPGFGLLQLRPSYGQVVPRLAAGGGRLMLLYYEARDPLTGPLPGFLAGLQRRMDVRTARLDPVTGRVQGTSQVSRYDIRASADVDDGEDVDDLVQNAPGSAAVNWTGKPTSAGGSSPFLGDYIDLVPAVQFVRTAQGRWRWATDPSDVPDRVFHAAFGDNRNLIPPSYPSNLSEGERYKFYAPPHQGGSCLNPGSRNTDVVSAQVEADLVAGAPVTFKLLENITRAFPIYVSNNTLEQRTYRLAISSGASFSSFDLSQDIDQLDVQILPNASTTRVVYANIAAGATAQVRVDVAQTNCNGTCATASVTFNIDPTNPLVTNPLVTNSEIHNPLVTNPLVTNPLVTNPLVTNVSKTNPLVTNPFVTNPLVTNPLVTNPLVTNQAVYDITDTTWVASNQGNTSSAYLSLINIDNAAALQQSYKFQLFIYRVTTRPGVDANCAPVAVPYEQLITTVPNPLVTNPLVTNPLVTNPLVTNPLVTNSTFYVAPAENATASASAAARPGVHLASFSIGAQAPGAATLAAPRAPDRVFITLRAFQIVQNPPVVFDPLHSPPSLAVYSQSPNITKLPDGAIVVSPPAAAFAAPDLTVATAAAAPATAAPGGTVPFPAGGAIAENIGQTAASPADGSVTYRVYLSADKTVSADDALLAAGAAAAPVQAGGQFSIPEQALRIPRTQAAGVYYLLLSVDDDLEVGEPDEANNVVAVPITVAIPGTGFLTFVTEPSSSVAGQPVLPAVQVLARDATGAVLPGVNVSLALASNPGDALLSGAIAATNAVGVATFPSLAVSRAAAGYQLGATALSLPPVLSAPFDVGGLGAAACGTPAFSVSQQTDHPVLTDPRAVAAADFNGDGRPDVVTANRGSGDVSLVLANAGGGFDPAVNYPAGATPAAVVAADINGDGAIDVAVALEGSSSVAVLLNDGAGHLGAPSAFPLGRVPVALAVGDFNEDGRTDLAVAARNADGTGTAVILRGSAFGSPLAFAAGGAGADTSAVAARDLNGDGHLDLIVANRGVDDLAVLIGTGTASFASAVHYPAGNGPQALATGDVNGDGHPDVAVGHETSTDIRVFFGSAAGALSSGPSLGFPGGVRGVALTDIDGDGALDVAAVHAEGFAIALGNGAGAFAPPRGTDPNFEPRGLAAADFNRDGLLDFAVANGSPANAVTFLINTCTAGPRMLVVSNTNDSGPGSLRQALQASEANAGHVDTVYFNIPGPGVHTITPSSLLPAVTDPAVIDGSTQPGYSASPLVEVNRGAAGPGNAFTITGGGTTIRALAIGNWSGNGVQIASGGGNSILGSYIGLRADGVTGAPNLGQGVQIIDSPGNHVGGSAPADRNVISRNQGEGVRIDGSPSTGNAVEGNYVGTTASGLNAAGNTLSGVYIRRAPANLVRNNIVSANTGFAGVAICGSPSFCGGGDAGTPGSNAAANVIVGNTIGLSVSGAALGNANHGVSIDDAPGNQVGGPTASDTNVISANADGVFIASPGATGNLVRGNYIGTDAAAALARGNTGAGVIVAGGTGNVVSGRDDDHTAPNVIMFNGTAGISVTGGAGHRLRVNRIEGNGGLGIDLGGAGVTPNDAYDTDGLQNAPVLTAATVSGGTVAVQGSLMSAAAGTYTIDLYASPACDVSGWGEGARWIGAFTVTTNADGNASFNSGFGGGLVTDGEVLTGVATSGDFVTTFTGAGATSEFSGCVTATPPGIFQWPLALGGNGHFYQLVDPSTPYTWTAASAAASTRTLLGVTGHLATVTSSDEQSFVWSLEGLNGLTDMRPWIGLYYLDGWRWVSGEPFGYAAWAPGEPTGDGPYGEFLGSVGGWNDITDVNPFTRGYVVEWDR